MKRLFKLVCIAVACVLGSQAFAENAITIETGYEALMTYSVSPELAQTKFPGIEPIPMGSIAGYLYAQLGKTHYHLVVLPSASIKYKGKYVTTVQVRDVGGLDGAVVTPTVAEYWVKTGLRKIPEHRIFTTQANQVLVTIMSDMPFTDLLNPTARHGKGEI